MIIGLDKDIKYVEMYLLEGVNLGLNLGRGVGGGGRVNCGTGVRASISKPTPFIYLAFEKTGPFIYLIVRNVDLFIYCLLIFIPIYCW